MRSDFIVATLAKFVQIGFGVISGIILARTLFAEGKGIIAAYNAPFGIVMSATALGIPMASSYFFSKKGWKISDISLIHSVMVFFGGILSSLILFLVLFIQELSDNLFIIIFLVFQVFIVKFVSFVNSIAIAKKWMKKIVFQEFIQSAVSFILIVVFFFILNKSVEWYFVAVVISQFIGILIIFSWLKNVDGYKFSLNLKRFFKLFKSFFSKSIMYALPLFVYGLNYKADILILNHYVSKSQIGFYSVAVTFSMLIWLIPDIFKRVVVSHSVATERENEATFSRNLWRNTIKIMVLSIVFVAVLYFVAPYFLPLFYGKEFINSVQPFQILLIGTFLMTGFKMLNGDLAARGRPEIALYIFSVMAILNIVFNLVFIPEYGISAAAWTSTGTYFLGSAVFMGAYFFVCGLNNGGKEN